MDQPKYNLRKDEKKGIVVYERYSTNHATCIECQKIIEPDSLMTLAEGKGLLCLECADLDHLEYLPAGDTALTRRARKHSTLSAVVLRWKKARQRFERQGVLVEKLALEKAEKECLSDEALREKRRERDAIRRQRLDVEYIDKFAKKIRELFPHCPEGEEIQIAEHACLKNSGRIGRSAEAKEFSDAAITLATIAHIRHTMTEYDSLLANGFARADARAEIRNELDEIMDKWRKGSFVMAEK